eukprot:CAMPEP_0169410634 /NCGR_PEP_ID=MMETSP1017-20121227/59878_1 /TAXON_ID=342587 /ORGANISM="Karlodinium micrum, Strain CCMP2283" /LENGTH=39 /DNA_ID= /DNA_START= /DNA_END= /DNA_ORIENTATION=
MAPKIQTPSSCDEPGESNAIDEPSYPSWKQMVCSEVRSN